MPSRVGRFLSDDAHQRYRVVYDRSFDGWPDRETRLVPTQFGHTAVQLVGPEGGVPLLLLHGMSMTSASWHPQVAAWATDHRVIAVDSIIDAGLSVQSAPVRGAADLAEWVAQVITGLGHDRAHLVGLSYGGWTALAAAQLAPDVVASVTAIEPAASLHRLPMAFWGNLASSFVGKTPPERWRWILGDDPDAVALDLLEASRLFRPAGFPLPGKFSDAEFRSIRCPVQIILGRESNVCHAGIVRTRAQRRLPGTRVTIVQDAGHAVTLDQPERVDELVRTFLAEAQHPPVSR